MPHSFCCEATDWLEAFGPPIKYFTLAIDAVILDGASVVQILKAVEDSIVQ